MQREKCGFRRRRIASATSRPSNPRVTHSREPPPPPPELLLELELEELDELELLLELLPLGFPLGVTPDVMAATQALLPALAGASVVARNGSTVTTAESVCPWSSVTVRRRR